MDFVRSDSAREEEKRIDYFSEAGRRDLSLNGGPSSGSHDFPAPAGPPVPAPLPTLRPWRLRRGGEQAWWSSSSVPSSSY